MTNSFDKASALLRLLRERPIIEEQRKVIIDLEIQLLAAHQAYLSLHVEHSMLQERCREMEEKLIQLED